MIRATALAALLILATPQAAAAPLKTPSPAPQPIPGRLLRLGESVAPAIAIGRQPTLRVAGIATWYDATRGGQTTWYTRAGVKHYGAAGPALRALVPHRYLNTYRVRLTSPLTGRSLIVSVVDFCSCDGRTDTVGDERLIDLAPAVWEKLGVNLGRGVMPVELEVLR